MRKERARLQKLVVSNILKRSPREGSYFDAEEIVRAINGFYITEDPDEYLHDYISVAGEIENLKKYLEHTIYNGKRR